MAENDEGGVATIAEPPNADTLADPGTVVEPTVVEPTEPASDARPRGPDGKFLPKTETPAAEAPKADAPAETDYSTVILPKDATIDSTVLERTVAIARERGLSSEQAQATVDLVNEQVAASNTALLESYQPGGAAWTKEVDGWKAETLADQALGKTDDERTASIAQAGSVIKAFKLANPAMGDAIANFLDTSGFGDRREVVHFMKWLGETAAERPISTSTEHRGAPKTTADIFYPKGADRTEEQVRADP